MFAWDPSPLSWEGCVSLVFRGSFYVWSCSIVCFGGSQVLFCRCYDTELLVPDSGPIIEVRPESQEVELADLGGFEHWFSA